MGDNDAFIDRKSPHPLRKLRNLTVQLRQCAWVVALFLAAPIADSATASADDLGSAFDSGTIIIEAEKDACYRFDVFIATTREQQVRGLMHVRQLPDFTGMLFVYTQPDIRSMWMKNTYISLDILFIRENGTIADIASDTEPLSLRSISSSEPVTYVLELNAGITARLHIGSDSLVHVQSNQHE
jgi:uncharacterized membrane protein (UPF0127 family)